MLTIKMLSNKDLIVTVQSKLYQRQSLVDKMQILIPATYDDIDLTPFTAMLEYIDPANIAHSEILVADEDLYKDTFIRYTLPLDSKFTYLAGVITMKLTLSYYDESVEKKYVLKTGELEITVEKLNDYFVYTDDSTLDTITNKIMELQTETDKLASVAGIYAENAVDDLVIEDDNILKVSANGKPLGNGVEILVNPQDTDGEADGQMDLDNSTTVDPATLEHELDLG